MEDPRQFLYDMLVEEFSDKPGFLLARTLFLFCHYNPAFEMPHDIMQKFIQGLREDEVRAFSLMYPLHHNKQDKSETDTEKPRDLIVESKKREIYNEMAAVSLSAGTGKTYTPNMVDEITRKYRGILSYNEILEILIMTSAQKRMADWELAEFTGMLKTFPVFSSLGENDVYDLFTLLRFKRYSPNETILKKGEPGTHLYIVLTGRAEVVDENGESLAVLKSGSIFGEMSLLTGASVATSVYSRGVTKLAALTSKDFKQVLHRYPVLHAFFYTLLIERAGKASEKVTADISAGMSGDISEVRVVELFQMINTSQKTGTVKLELSSGNAKVYFKEGEIVYAKYGKLKGRRAVFALLGVTKGQFTYSPGIPYTAEAYEVVGGFMGLVMEGMQRLDEEANVLETA